MPRVARPQLGVLAGGGRLLAHLEQLERPHHPRAVGGLDGRRRGAAPARASSACRAGAPSAAHAALEPLAQLRRRRRRAGRGRSGPRAGRGPCRRPRSARRPGARARRRSPGGPAARRRPPRSSRVTGTNPTRRCSSRSRSSAGGRAGQGLEALVDLERVRRDRHRILAPRPQALGERQRDGRLADAGRAEEGDQPVRQPARAALPRRRGSCSCPVRYSTSTSSPGRAHAGEVHGLVVTNAAARFDGIGTGGSLRPAPPSCGPRALGARGGNAPGRS